MFVHKSPSTPVFENALEYCQSVDNNYVYSDQGTAQDICIDDYMIGNFIFYKFLLTFIFFILLFLFLRMIYLLNKNIKK